PGFGVVSELVGLAAAIQTADLVITGEGRLDATSFEGKVVGEVLATADEHGRPVRAVVGSLGDDAGSGRRFADLEVSAPAGAGDDPAREVQEAAARLADRVRA
ncbi:MAG: glycerate kinase, partial [Nitriliruptoraceae bacterium]